MAPQHSKVSITETVKESEFIRNITRDYFIQAARLFTPKINRSSESNHDKEKFDNGMNRYYQIKVNSLLDLEHDDIDYIVRLSEKNVNCIKCGSTKKLRLRNRRNQNKSDQRKYSKYLRSICDHHCDSCNSTFHRSKLLGRLQVIDKLQQLQQQPTQSIAKPSDTNKSINNKTQLIDTRSQTKPPFVNISAKTIDQQGAIDQIQTQPKTVQTTAKPAPAKSYRPGQSRPKLKPVKLPPSKINQQNKPQFSSRLRSFSCLLEE